jgi:hypothetical protein
MDNVSVVPVLTSRRLADRKDAAAANDFMELRMQQLAQDVDAKAARDRQQQMAQEMKDEAERKRLQQLANDTQKSASKEQTDSERKEAMRKARLAALERRQ